MVKHILALSPHTDDIEIGAGGTIHKFVQMGCRVKVIAFSWCEDERLIKEFTNSCLTLGVDLFLYLEFERREFPRDRQEILDFLISERNHHNYDLILCTGTNRQHQDHEVICNEAFRAFRDKTIWGYDIPKYPHFKAEHWEILSKENVEAKIKSLDCYYTQKKEKKKLYFQNNVILSNLTYRGSQKEVAFAEAFEIITGVNK